MNHINFNEVIPKMTKIGRLMTPEGTIPKYRVKRSTLKYTCTSPQIWEVECVDGTLLYIRFNDGELTCKEKKTGSFICSGSPVLDKLSIPENKLEFYLEMYSQHLIYFE